MESDNEGDTNPHPLDATAKPLTPTPKANPIPSLNNPIRFANVNVDDDSDRDDDEKKPSHRGHGLPEIAMMKLQKARTLEHNDTDPSGGMQALLYQLIPYALEWSLDSDIPRLRNRTLLLRGGSTGLALSPVGMYNQIDVILQDCIVASSS
jgi:hypothetical protein